MSEGFLDGSAICLYIASACVGVYSKGEFVRIEVDRYTDFSDKGEISVKPTVFYISGDEPTGNWGWVWWFHHRFGSPAAGFMGRLPQCVLVMVADR